ncbi:MAG: hypothetical protein MZV63_57100 [Marinilabiliales bacterium]|nr:hypothetical protein [Marinilabiliales bacterium]
MTCLRSGKEISISEKNIEILNTIERLARCQVQGIARCKCHAHEFGCGDGTGYFTVRFCSLSVRNAGDGRRCSAPTRWRDLCLDAIRNYGPVIIGLGPCRPVPDSDGGRRTP